MVRRNLVELDALRDEQEEIYNEMLNCYGLERCLKQTNVLGLDTRKSNRI